MPDMPRAVRVPDELWLAAIAKAQQRGETVSDIVRGALERYVAKP
jgi:predicted DNA-binding protein